MHILYLGSKKGNSLLRARALERLGHTVHHFDPDPFLPGGPKMTRIHYETGGLLAASGVAKALLAATKDVPRDMVYVDGGRWIGPKLVRELKKRTPVLDYTVDDAYGSRDRLSWLLFRKATPEYDVIGVKRKENLVEGKALGGKKMVFVHSTADELAHRPRSLTAEEAAKWTNDVVFIGTGLDRRGGFITDLIRLGVPLSVYGNKWESQKEWPQIQPNWKGAGTKTESDYSAAIIGAKVSLGLLSKGNRDLHTRRSVEIPACAGVFCGERTSEHLEMYVENEEAVFWDTAEECAEACNRLMKAPEFRAKIARQGHERCLRNGYYNENFCVKLLTELMPSAGPDVIQPGKKPGELIVVR